MEANPVKMRPQYSFSAVMENLKLDYCLDKCEDDSSFSFIGPLQLTVTWYKNPHAGEQIAQLDV